MRFVASACCLLAAAANAAAGGALVRMGHAGIAALALTASGAFLIGGACLLWGAR